MEENKSIITDKGYTLVGREGNPVTLGASATVGLVRFSIKGGSSPTAGNTAGSVLANGIKVDPGTFGYRWVASQKTYCCAVPCFDSGGNEDFWYVRVRVPAGYENNEEDPASGIPHHWEAARTAALANDCDVRPGCPVYDDSDERWRNLLDVFEWDTADTVDLVPGNVPPRVPGEVIPSDACLHDDPACDRRISIAEGWCIIDVDSTGVLEIEKDDDAGVFASDEEAVEFVRQKAAAGSTYHQKAMAIHLKTHPPDRHFPSDTDGEEGHSCPLCGDDRITVTATAPFSVSSEGAVYEEGDVEWDDDDPASCRSCEWAGSVRQTEAEGRDYMDDELWEVMPVKHRLQWFEKYGKGPFPSELRPYLGRKVRVMFADGQEITCWVGQTQGWDPHITALGERNAVAGESLRDRRPLTIDDITPRMGDDAPAEGNLPQDGYRDLRGCPLDSVGYLGCFGESSELLSKLLMRVMGCALKAEMGDGRITDLKITDSGPLAHDGGKDGETHHGIVRVQELTEEGGGMIPRGEPYVASFYGNDGLPFIKRAALY